MSWVEHIDETGSGSIDYLDHRRAARVFRVWDYSRDAIFHFPESILNDSGQSLPKIGEDWNGMTLDRYDVSPGPGNVWTATALYSNDRRFISFSGPNFANAEWQVSFTTAVFELPFAKDGRMVIDSAPSPIQDPSIAIWIPETMMVTSTIVRYMRRVDIPRNYVSAMLDALETQNNRLHLIAGYYYRFEACDAYESTKDTWSVTYSWTSDRGFKRADLHVPIGAQNYYPELCKFFDGNTGGPFYTGNVWSRPPYHTTVMMLPTQVTDLLAPRPTPKFEAVCQFRRDDLGWSDLPLVGNL